MSIRASSHSESFHKKEEVQTAKEKKGILAGAIAGSNSSIPVTFNRQSSSPINDARKNVSGTSIKSNAKGIAARKANPGNAKSTGPSKKAQRKSSSKSSSKSKKSGGAEGVETPEAEDETQETEGKSIGAIREISDFKKEDQQQGKREELFARLEEMARQDQVTDLQDIIDTAWGNKGVYEDVTEAYDGLRAAQDHFGNNDEDLLKNLSHSTRAAGDIIYRENGPDIRAGYLFGPGTDETQSYREHVLRFEKVSDTFQAIMEKAEGDSRVFTKEIDKLIKGIQIDIKEQESTLDPSHLRQIMQGLFTVQICSQLEKECGLLLRDMQTFYGENNQPQINNE